MFKNELATATAILALIFAIPASADKETLKNNISAARQAVKAIAAGGDVSNSKKEIAEYSAKVDAEVDSVPGLKSIWTEFKQTRDGTIVPAFESKNPDSIAKAKELVTGIQAERFQKMMDLLKGPSTASVSGGAGTQ